MGYSVACARNIYKENDLTTKNSVRDVVELKLNPCAGKNADKHNYFFDIGLQAKRLKLIIYRLFSRKRRRRDWLFHELYERQKRGLRLSTFLRSFEGNAVFTGLGNTGDLSVNRGLEQQHGGKTKNESNGGPNESVGHSGIGMANVVLTGAGPEISGNAPPSHRVRLKT